MEVPGERAKDPRLAASVDIVRIHSESEIISSKKPGAYLILRSYPR